MNVLNRNSHILISYYNFQQDEKLEIAYDKNTLQIQYEVKDGVFVIRTSKRSSVVTNYFAMNSCVVSVIEDLNED